ncbi:multicopper oxidase domain-containing protein [Actinomyces urogenitalis]|nr:multicopper oxidase domain-containing protein [Actinomyces urogenitalis]
MSHSIDFHAGIVSPDKPMRSIGPGESLVYTFTAQHSGIWLYHCSTAPMSLHLASGMYGAVIIDPDGLAEVDREYLLIQAETYLGLDSGQQEEQTATSTAMTDKIAAKTPDLVCFNGVAFQYALAPLQARAGERIRLWVLDAGPSLPTSFHVVGLQFDTVFAEGTYLLGGPQEIGRAWHGGSQALALQPAQGGFVEAVVPAAGHYAMVTHVFADMDKGAKGILEAV